MFCVKRTTIVAVLIILSIQLIALSATHATKLKVVTTFSIMSDIAREVAGNAAIVTSIVKPGAEVHRYKVTPGDMKRMEGAELIFLNGLGLEIWFKKFLNHTNNIPKVVISERIALIDIKEQHKLEEQNKQISKNYCYEIKCSEETDCKMDKVPLYEKCIEELKQRNSFVKTANPHVWLSPVAGLVYVNNIRDIFIMHDPKNADEYMQNAEKYKERLLLLIAEIRSAIAKLPPTKRWLATCEGAFSYFARDFGLKEIYVWPVNNELQGTPQNIRAAIDKIIKHNVGVVFSETTNSPKQAQVIAQNTGARYGGALYADTLSKKEGKAATYIDLLRYTTSTIIEELGR